jgi:hypothetical protein
MSDAQATGACRSAEHDCRGELATHPTGRDISPDTTNALKEETMEGLDPLKMYMGYDRIAGQESAAVLVFAHNSKEARKLTFEQHPDNPAWVDTATWVLDEDPFLRAQQLYDYPHVIESPKVCKHCLLWGLPMHDADTCEECWKEMEG